MKKILTLVCLLGLAVPVMAQRSKDEQPELLPLPREKMTKPEGTKPEGTKPEGTKPETAEPEEAEHTPLPPVDLVIFPGEAVATPHRKGVSWANGGVIDVSQPNPTTIVVTMSGLCATNADLICDSIAGYHFDLTQCFGVRFNSRKVKGAHLTIEGRVMGLLRTNHELYQHCWCKKGGTAETEVATASIRAGDAEIVTLTLPAHSICCEDDLSVYNHEGPLYLPVTAGKYTLHEGWGFDTLHPPFFCRGASAEFAPQPSYTPEASSAYWFQHFHPFDGAATKDFGYQVTIKVIAD